jgi:flagellin
MAVVSTNTNFAAGAVSSNIGRKMDDMKNESIKLASGMDEDIKNKPAEVAIGKGLETQVTVLKNAQQNAEVAVQFINVAAGGTKSVLDITQRMKSLTTAGAAGTMSQAEIDIIAAEFAQLVQEMDRQVEGTSFNGIKMLNGDYSGDKTIKSSSTGSEAKYETRISFNADTAQAVTAEGDVDEAALYINGVGFAWTDAKNAGDDSTTGPNISLGFQAEGTVNSKTAAEKAQKIADIINNVGGVQDAAGFVGGAGSHQSYVRQQLAQISATVDGDTLVIKSVEKGVHGYFDTELGSEVTLSAGAAADTLSVTTVVAGDLTVDTTNEDTFNNNFARISFGANGIATGGQAGELVINGVTFNFVNTAAAGFDDNYNNGGAVDVDVNDNTTDRTAAQYAAFFADLINDTTSQQANMATAEAAKLQGIKATVVDTTDIIIEITDPAVNLTVVTLGTSADIVASVTDQINGTQANTGAISVSANTKKIAAATESNKSSGSLGLNNVVVGGSVGSAMIAAQTQTQASTGWVTIADSLINADDKVINVAGRAFTLKSNVANQNKEILRHTSDTFKTLQNVANFLNNVDDPTVNNFYFEVRQNGGNNQLKMTAKAADATFNGANGLLVDTQYTNLASGATTGINMSKVTDNADFLGNIQGFTAKYLGSDSVLASLQIGDVEYQSVIADTTPTSGTNVTYRFDSTELDGTGGYFEITLAGGQGQAVTDQTTANTYATALDQAFNSLKFYQHRELDTLELADTLLEEARISMVSDNFTMEVKSVEVLPSTSSIDQEAEMRVTLSDGRVFENVLDINENVAAGQLIKLSNTENSDEYIQIIFGKDIDFTSSSEVKRLESEMEEIFKVNAGGLDFQVGVEATQKINVQVSGLTTSILFSGQDLTINTQADLINLSDTIDGAIDKLKLALANLGAYSKRFDFTTQNLDVSIQNIDEARATYLDADAAEASTKYANASVALQAGLQMLAQVNQIPQFLLQIIGR